MVMEKSNLRPQTVGKLILLFLDFLVCMKISVPPTKMRILRQTEKIKLCQCHLQSKL